AVSSTWTASPSSRPTPRPPALNRSIRSVTSVPGASVISQLYRGTSDQGTKEPGKTSDGGLVPWFLGSMVPCEGTHPVCRRTRLVWTRTAVSSPNATCDHSPTGLLTNLSC